MQVPTLKFSHHSYICIYQVTWMSLFFHPLITEFTHHASRHTYHLREALTLLSPMESQSSLIFIHEDIVFLVRTLHWHVDGNYSGQFIVSLTLTLVDSIHIWIRIYPLFTLSLMKSLQNYIPGLWQYGKMLISSRPSSLQIFVFNSILSSLCPVPLSVPFWMEINHLFLFLSNNGNHSIYK